MTASYSGSRMQQAGKPNQSGTGRFRTRGSSVLAPASWLLAAVALVLIGVLTYYLTLTTRPEISEIHPAPNSEQNPGMVDLSAEISSQRSIEEAIFYVDGEPVSTSLDQIDDGRWQVEHQQIFERGEREVLLSVTDSSGRTAEHTWSFDAGGDLIEPRMVMASPPPDAILQPGRIGITIQSTTFAEIDDVELTFNGESVSADVQEVDSATEYTNQSDIPVFDWHIQATDRLEPGETIVEANITDKYGASSSGEWTISVAEDDTSANARYFEQTNEYIAEPFLSYWDENNGSTTIGSPVGPAFSEGDGAERQYFQYARLELDEEGTIHRGLIGREVFGEPENPPDRTPGSGARQFDTTGHYIVGTIRDFWEENGGLGTFGYPLSQEFETETGYAQYFERALIEVSELGSYEFVELAPLGERLYEEYLIGANGGLSTDESP